MKKPKIEPFKDGEYIKLSCGGEFQINAISCIGFNLDISNIVCIHPVDVVILPITAKDIEDLKLLIKRAEKTFKKE